MIHSKGPMKLGRPISIPSFLRMNMTGLSKNKAYITSKEEMKLKEKI